MMSYEHVYSPENWQKDKNRYFVLFIIITIIFTLGRYIPEGV